MKLKNAFKKIMMVIATFAVLLTSFPIDLIAKKPQEVEPNLGNGVVIEGEKQSGSNEVGNTLFTKTVTEAGTSEDGKYGLYDVSLNVKGPKVKKEETVELPVYAVVLFDRSGSMQNFCIGSITEWITNGHGEAYGRGTKEECSGLGQLFGNNIYLKWSNAVNGAKIFAENFRLKFTNSELALVTFANDVTVNSKDNTGEAFHAADFSGLSFGKPSGRTDLTSGLQAAGQLLAGKTKNSKKVIVLVSDGVPNNASTAETTAEYLRTKAGIEIYTVGYDGIDDENNYHSLSDSAKNTLINIAGSADHYSYSSPDNIKNILNNVVTTMSNLPAGIGATITDTIDDNFIIDENSFKVDGSLLSLEDTNLNVNGNKVTYNVGNITENGTTITFKIKLDKTKKAGKYYTNNTDNYGVSVTYMDTNGDTVVNSISSSSMVNHNPDYTYKVEYYYDGVIDNTKTFTSTAKFGTKITTYTDKNIDGYKKGKEENLPLTISDDENKNVIKVYYVKDNFKYHYDYYYYDDYNDNTYSVESSEIFSALYGTKIENFDPREKTGYKFYKKENLPFEVSSNEANNVANICYKRAEYYTVKHHYEGIEEVGEETSSDSYFVGTEINVENIEKKVKTGYSFNTTESTNKLIISARENVIDLYYNKNSYEYSIEYYYDEILDENSTIVKEALYGTEINDYNKKEKDGYEFSKVENMPLIISDNEENNVIRVYYVTPIEDEYIVPPKTSVNTNYLSLLIELISIGLFIRLRKLI